MAYYKAVADIILNKQLEERGKKVFDDAIDKFKTTSYGTRFNRLDQGKEINMKGSLLREIISSGSESNKIITLDPYLAAWEKTKDNKNIIDFKTELEKNGMKMRFIEEGGKKLVVQELPPNRTKGEDKTRFALIDTTGPKLLVIEGKSEDTCARAWLSIELEKIKQK